METAVPYYSAYINADCQLGSELSPNYVPLQNLSDACQQVNTLVLAINEPYTGSNSSDRLAWLKRRQSLLLQRSEVIKQALVQLGSQDTVDHTAASVKSITGIASTLTTAIPGIGLILGPSLGIVGNLAASLFDQTGTDTAKKNEEISYYKSDYAGLLAILETTNAEIDRLNYVNYALYGLLAVLVLILLFHKKKHE